MIKLKKVDNAWYQCQKLEQNFLDRFYNENCMKNARLRFPSSYLKRKKDQKRDEGKDLRM
jgi:hypothetical protein